MRLIKDAPYTGERGIDLVGAVFSVLAMGGIVLGILVWQEGGERVLAFIVVGVVSMAALAWWLVRRKRAGQLPLIDPGLFESKNFQSGVVGQLLQQVTLGGTMIALPIFLQMVLEYNAMQAGLSIAPLSLSMFAVALVAGKRFADRRPAAIIRLGYLLTTVGLALILPLVPRVDSGLWLLVPLRDRRVRARAARVAAQQLHAGAHLGRADQRGRGRQLRRRQLRALVRPRARRQPDAGDAVGDVHQR